MLVVAGSAKAAKRMSTDGTSSHQNNIDYSDILGVAQIESYKANSSGFDITTVATTKDGQLVDKRVRFSHPDSQLIGSWVAAILKAVKDCCHGNSVISSLYTTLAKYGLTTATVSKLLL